MALTPKQAAFVAAYIETGNAAQSAITAGYPEASARSVGSENLTKPDIIAAIAAANGTAIQRVQAAQDSAVASAEWVVQQAVEAVQFGFTKVPERNMFGQAIKDENDQPVLRLRDPRTATTNLALLAKRHPEFREQGQQTPSQTLILNGLSDAQLDAAIAKLAGGSA